MSIVENEMYRRLGSDLSEYILEFRMHMYIQEKLIELYLLYDTYKERKVIYVFNNTEHRIKHLLNACVSDRLTFLHDLSMSSSFISILDFSNAFLELGGGESSIYLRFKQILKKEEIQISPLRGNVFELNNYCDKTIKKLMRTNDIPKERKNLKLSYVEENIKLIRRQIHAFDALLEKISETNKLKLKMYQFMLKYVYDNTHSWSFFLKEICFLIDNRLLVVKSNLEDNYEAYKHFINLNSDTLIEHQYRRFF